MIPKVLNADLATALDALLMAAERAIREEHRVVVPVVGAEKSGKSTLVNRLAGRQVVTADAVEPTQHDTRVEISFSPSGSQRRLRSTLVDTPRVHDLEGFSALCKRIGATDAVLWCVLAEQGITADTRRLLEGLDTATKARVTVVITRVDDLSAVDLARKREHVLAVAKSAGITSVVAVEPGYEPGQAVPEVLAIVRGRTVEGMEARVQASLAELQRHRAAVLAASAPAPIQAAAPAEAPDRPMGLGDPMASARYLTVMLRLGHTLGIHNLQAWLNQPDGKLVAIYNAKRISSAAKWSYELTRVQVFGGKRSARFVYAASIMLTFNEADSVTVLNRFDDDQVENYQANWSYRA